jgi:lipid II isoglutaminyl synthase (glutamine-hydrolysing)
VIIFRKLYIAMLHPVLTLLHLYPNEMNLYGDRGNVLALVQLAQWAGVEVQVLHGSLGAWDESWNKTDLIFMGGGQDAQQLEVVEDLHRHKAASIKALIAEGVGMLGICGGYQFMGHYYKPHSGDELKGLSVLDAHTVAGHTRFIGNVVVEPNPVLGLTATHLVGFENHSGLTHLGEGVEPLGRVVVGHGNNASSGFEGAVSGNLCGTYLHGALLPKNPALTQYLLQQAWGRISDTAFPEVDAQFTRLADKAREEALVVAKQKQNR